jgi:hypothetical protein
VVAGRNGKAAAGGDVVDWCGGGWVGLVWGVGTICLMG